MNIEGAQNELISVLAIDDDEREVEDEEQAERRADKVRIKELEAQLAKVGDKRKGKGRGKYAIRAESDTH